MSSKGVRNTDLRRRHLETSRGERLPPNEGTARSVAEFLIERKGYSWGLARHLAQLVAAAVRGERNGELYAPTTSAHPSEPS